MAADRVDDAAAHYRALAALEAESPDSMEVLASLASAYGRQREQGAEVSSAGPQARQVFDELQAVTAHVACGRVHPSCSSCLTAVTKPGQAI